MSIDKATKFMDSRIANPRNRSQVEHNDDVYMAKEYFELGYSQAKLELDNKDKDLKFQKELKQKALNVIEKKEQQLELKDKVIEELDESRLFHKKEMFKMAKFHDEMLQEMNDKDKQYNELLKVAIETAFDEQNKDTEFLCRVLLAQNQITLENGQYNNPQRNENFIVCGIKYEKEKAFLINDDKLDEYTKQLEIELDKKDKEIQIQHEGFMACVEEKVKLCKKLEKKDKVINLIIKYISRNWNTTRFCSKENLDDCKCEKYLDSKCVLKYFEKLAKEE